MYGAVNARQIPRLLQYSTNEWFVYSAPLSLQKARGTPMSVMKRFTTARMAAAICRGYRMGAGGGGAVHEHNDVPRSTERCRERARGIDVDKLHRPLGARRRIMGSWRPVPLCYRIC